VLTAYQAVPSISSVSLSKPVRIATHSALCSLALAATVAVRIGS
jgi:hypothetical protein